MAAPRTTEEERQARQTMTAAGPAENLVSTGCPECGVRFALLARFDPAGWLLRCTRCGVSFRGQLKEGQ